MLQRSLSWLGAGAGGGMVLLAACLGGSGGAVRPAPGAVRAPALQAEQVLPPGPRFAPACPAVYRAGAGCEALGRAPGRLLRT